MGWVKLSDPVDFFKVEWSDLNHDIHLLITFRYCIGVLAVRTDSWMLLLGGVAHTDLRVKVHFSVDRGRNQIKQRNNITREVL